MEVIPGSHKLGQLHHAEHSEATNNLLSRGQTITVEFDKSRTEFMPLRAGQLSLHHTHLAHNSRPNLQPPGPRSAPLPPPLTTAGFRAHHPARSRRPTAPCPRLPGCFTQCTMAFPGRPAVRRPPRAAPPAAKVSYAPPEGRGQGEGGGVKPENLTTP